MPPSASCPRACSKSLFARCSRSTSCRRTSCSQTPRPRRCAAALCYCALCCVFWTRAPMYRDIRCPAVITDALPASLPVLPLLCLPGRRRRCRRPGRCCWWAPSWISWSPPTGCSATRSPRVGGCGVVRCGVVRCGAVRCDAMLPFAALSSAAGYQLEMCQPMSTLIRAHCTAAVAAVPLPLLLQAPCLS